MNELMWKRLRISPLLAAGAALLLTSCGTTLRRLPEVARLVGLQPGVTQAECLATAERYRTHRWTATARNVKHGTDTAGIRVDTPDAGFANPGSFPGWWVTNGVNVGLPYQWGGFSTPEEFDAGVSAGLAAGDVYTLEKRARLDDAVSREAVGIDCSGFISRCWNLPQAYSTRELPKLCRAVAWDDLQPGNILNTANAHVLLFAGWEGADHSRLLAYETGCPPTWKIFCHTISVPWLKGLGYSPWRYRRMQP